jgi:hypothetical protein
VTTTRYFCPLDCGWHHDQADGDVLVAEAALREHCESHPLEQWVRALVATRRRAIRAERAVVAVDGAMQRADLGPVLAAVHDAIGEWKGEQSDSGRQR